MKMVISTSQNYFIELHRAWWRSREKSYVKSIWHTVGAEQKFIFTLLSLPPSFSFTSHLPLSLSSSPTLAAASAGLGVNRRRPKLWKLLSFYLTAAYCSRAPSRSDHPWAEVSDSDGAPWQPSPRFVQWMTLAASWGAAVLGTSECWLQQQAWGRDAKLLFLDLCRENSWWDTS